MVTKYSFKECPWKVPMGQPVLGTEEPAVNKRDTICAFRRSRGRERDNGR